MPSAANDPPNPRLTVSDADLADYAEGRLAGNRRRAVEGMLACNPDLAAQVMTRMHMAGGSRPPRRRRGMTTAALVLGLVAGLGSGAGLAAISRQDHDGWRELDGGDPPGYLEDAAESREASRLREDMASQVETPRLDAGEIRRTLRVALPRLPDEWLVRDVQVFPTDDGPSVNLVVVTPQGRRLELFAVRAPASGEGRPEIAQRGREVVAFWERGESAYVLAGPQSARDLLLEASALAQGANL
jgi:hypothetical protein